MVKVGEWSGSDPTIEVRGTRDSITRLQGYSTFAPYFGLRATSATFSHFDHCNPPPCLTVYIFHTPAGLSGESYILSQRFVDRVLDQGLLHDLL